VTKKLDNPAEMKIAVSDKYYSIRSDNTYGFASAVFALQEVKLGFTALCFAI
jgi:hypothetical protein